MNGTWVGLIRRRASSGSNHSTRSISGNRTSQPGPRRPLHLELVRAGPRPDPGRPRPPAVDDLAALLDDRPELDGRRRRVDLGAGLLGELAPRDGIERLARAVGLALRDRPVTEVALREVRPARMGQQDLRIGEPRAHQGRLRGRRYRAPRTHPSAGRAGSPRSSAQPSTSMVAPDSDTARHRRDATATAVSSDESMVELERCPGLPAEHPRAAVRQPLPARTDPSPRTDRPALDRHRRRACAAG